jgi:glycosyltransferase involved in cell wall biosynthesis
MAMAESNAGGNSTPPPPVPAVLHVADAEAFARFGRMFRQLGLALTDAGIRVALLTDDAEAAADLDGTPVEDHLFRPLSGWGTWRLHGHLRRQFEPPPDIVHVWGTTALAYLSDWTLSRNKSLVIHITSLHDIERLDRRGVRDNEQVIAACTEFEELLCERWPTLVGSFRVHRPALLLPETSAPLAVRNRTLGLLWTGRIERDAGLDVLVDAVARLRAQECDLQLALIGVGPATRQVWRNIRARGVQDRVSIVAEPNLWDSALPGTDILVVPTCQHEVSLAPLLAMAHGKVVIASRDQIAEWFIENETALEFTPGSAVELAYHVTQTAASHPSVMAVARGAAEYAREHHAITRLADELDALYRSLLVADGAAPDTAAQASRESS